MPGINMMPSGSTLQIPLDACTGFSAKAGNAQVTLTWTDPKDKYATPEGEQAQDPQQLVSVWDHTVLVRKTGSSPTGPLDGTQVVSSSVRNQYQTTGFTDTGLTNDTTYYYGVFAYNKDGVPSAGAFTSAMPQAGTPLSSLAEGTIIKINENGSPVEFYLAKHNYEPDLNGQGRELVVRKDCYDNQVWDNGNDNDNEYSTSDLDAWLNAAYFNSLSGYVKEQLATTKFYYTPSGKARAVALDRGVFTPSITELDVDAKAHNATEGSPLPIATALQIACYSGAAVNQFTRSPYKGTTQTILGVLSDGTFWSSDVFLTVGFAYARPCFTLPSTALVDQDLNLIETAVQTTALSAA